MAISVVFITALAAFVLTLVVFSPHVVVRGLQRLFPDIIWSVHTDDPLVALSFDDGPHPVYTPAILQVLREYNAHATFFVVGAQARAHPDLVAAICADGHEVGNHTDGPQRTLTMSMKVFTDSFTRAEAAISATPCAARLFRPAGIWIRPRQIRFLEAAGYVCVLGSAYAHDPLKPPSAYIASVISRGMHPGAIIALHDAGGDRTMTVRALPYILQHAHTRGIKVVTVSSLLSHAVKR
jgi:peptidoglycan-N-acetylglucosamine deacetylase